MQESDASNNTDANHFVQKGKIAALIHLFEFSCREICKQKIQDFVLPAESHQFREESIMSDTIMSYNNFSLLYTLSDVVLIIEVLNANFRWKSMNFMSFTDLAPKYGFSRTFSNRMKNTVQFRKQKNDLEDLW